MPCYHTLPNQCPVCLHEHDAATSVGPNDGAPAPGDFTVCIECASILRWTDGMRLRVFSELDTLDLATRGLLELAQRHVKASGPS